MKYTYAYKTSDGIRHEGSMKAASRDEVFAELRKQGIKAIKVVAADGSKSNGEVRGVRKRIVFFAILSASLVATFSTWFLTSEFSGAREFQSSDFEKKINAQPLNRQMINGDRVRIDETISSLQNPVERFIAAFAEPGRPVIASVTRPPDDLFLSWINEPIKYSESELTETIDLKRILSGMQAEMLEYLRGGGSVSSYIDELYKRQKLEISYRDKAQENLKKRLNGNSQEAYTYWLKANAALEAMGIYPLPLPTVLREVQLKHGLLD